MWLYQLMFAAAACALAVELILRLFLDVHDFGLHWHPALKSGSFDWQLFLPLRPSLLVVFIAVFGLSGWILMGGLGFGPLVTPLAALILSCAVNAAIRLLRAKPPVRREEALVGLKATVVEPIEADGWGKIAFTFRGEDIIAPARCVDNAAAEVGDTVEILLEKGGLYFVELAEESKTAPPTEESTGEAEGETVLDTAEGIAAETGQEEDFTED